MSTFENPMSTVSSQPINIQERMLDSDEAAGLLRIHPKTLQRMARRGEVKGFRIGKLWRFRGADLFGEQARNANVMQTGSYEDVTSSAISR
jgi:excisionase family DNA binding protein